MCCLVLALIHWLSGNVDVIRVTMLLYAPLATVGVFWALVMFHTIGLFKMCCGNQKPRPIELSKKPTTKWGWVKAFYNQYLGTDGLLGRRGKYYNWRIFLREVVEIPTQTYQAYLLSQRSPYTIFPRLYGVIIALDCILVPIILLSSRMASKWNYFT